MAHLLPKCNSETEECLLAFLQSFTAYAAVGHWLSLLLKKDADVEVARAHRGSAKAADVGPIFPTKVGTPDALPFFLPGDVTQFAKVLHVSKTMIGAARNAEAIDQAIRGFAEFLMIVLEDDANLSALGTTGDISKDESTVSFLMELRSLPVKTQGQSEMVAENPSEAVRKDVPNFGFKGKGSVNAGNMIGSLNVSRTKDWIIKTSAHVYKLLSATFPQVFLGYLFLSSREHHIQYDFAGIFSRFMLCFSVIRKEKLGVKFGHLIQKKVTISRFLDVFALCFNQKSEQHLLVLLTNFFRPSSTGYLHSITEMSARIFSNDDNKAITDVAPSEVRKFPSIQNKGVPCPVEDV